MSYPNPMEVVANMETMANTAAALINPSDPGATVVVANPITSIDLRDHIPTIMYVKGGNPYGQGIVLEPGPDDHTPMGRDRGGQLSYGQVAGSVSVTLFAMVGEGQAALFGTMINAVRSVWEANPHLLFTDDHTIHRGISLPIGPTKLQADQGVFHVGGMLCRYFTEG